MTEAVPDLETRSLDSQLISVAIRVMLVGLLALTLLAQPVAAQSGDENPVCGKEGMDTIANIIEGWVKLTAGLGLMAMIAVWQANTLAEMFTNNPDSRRQLKQHKRTIGKSGLTLVALGPGATIAGRLMGLPVTECVNLIPF